MPTRRKKMVKIYYTDKNGNVTEAGIFPSVKEGLPFILTEVTKNLRLIRFHLSSYRDKEKWVKARMAKYLF